MTERTASLSHWIHGDGIKQPQIPAELLPPPVAADPPANPVDELTAGINIAGYFRAELGVGEAARLLTSAVEAAGVPHSTATYDDTPSRQGHLFLDRPPRLGRTTSTWSA